MRRCAMTKTLHIKTYGCQMNVYDSDRMADVLAPLGYAQVDSAEGADMVILNTCHIREKAAEKVFSELGRLRPLKEDGPDGMILAVAGCVAQAEGAEIMRRAPYVDMVFGPQSYHRLPEMVARASRAMSNEKGGGVLDTEFPADAKFDSLPAPSAPDGPAAFLTIQEGCDKFCTFCVVPYTRGAEYSRPVADIVAEAERFASQGVRDVTLLGQNVNAYHDGKAGLGNLIRALAGIDGLERIRYTTSHPRDVDGELIAAHRDVPECMPFLHLPVQSGSDRILKAMNRGHTAATYLDVVDELRAARPDLALSSDFIVGFPGETDADFEATMKLVREVTFASAYSFKYSPRPGTPAAVMEDAVEPEVASARLTELQAELKSQQDAFNAAALGQTMPVLFERPGRNLERHPGQLVGRSPYLQAVHVDQPDAAIGDIVDIRIDGQTTHGLTGTPAAAPLKASA